MSIQWSGRVKHRNAVTTNDSSNPTTDGSVGIDLSGYKFAVIDVSISGGTFDVTPIFLRDGVWFAGETQTAVATNTTFKIEVIDATRFYVKLTGAASSPNCSVWVTPYNSQT